MDVVLTAVADPTRRLLLERLRTGDGLSIAALADGLPMSRQAVTKHLDLLRDAGLVRVRRQGRERLHDLDARPLEAVEDWLRPYAEAWDARLAALRAHLGEDEPEVP
jgi:DNA-binding transcriptional ArsR family regulator